MKRIEAFIKKDELLPVVNNLKSLGVGGVSVVEIRGRGQSELPTIQGLRGTARFVANFNSKNLVITIVEDSKVEQVINTIIDAAGTGTKADGKIFVSTIDETIDIGSNSKGNTAL